MNKPTLVLVHGLVGSLRYFDPQPRLPGVVVEAPDLLGYGANRDVAQAELTLAAQAEHVAECLRNLGAAPAWLLGHSMGGAIAMLLADRHPELIAGIINVEGNFTLQDAFWSGRIARMTAGAWAERYRAMQADVPGWLRDCNIEPTPRRMAYARVILEHQPAATLQAMSRAIVAETGSESYAECVQRVVRHVNERGLPLHLLAGEKSAAGWDVPDFVRSAATSYAVQPGVGHVMMLEDPEAFCGIVQGMLADPSAAHEG
ncbi:MAG TPA: alpha/beta hydrolase [Phycisphaerae bacterium]|nr:alpha/beta hydrolase [Phycisphaerae bacterium]HNU45207.1 alpha/beta hydrolase [Phycisphaerae bacterium]